MKAYEVHKIDDNARFMIICESEKETIEIIKYLKKNHGVRL